MLAEASLAIRHPTTMPLRYDAEGLPAKLGKTTAAHACCQGPAGGRAFLLLDLWWRRHRDLCVDEDSFIVVTATVPVTT